MSEKLLFIKPNKKNPEKPKIPIIRPPQKQYPPLKPHRQPERRPSKPQKSNK